MKHSHEAKRSLLFSSVQAQGIWILSAAVLLLIFCAVAYSMEDPDSVLLPLSLCALYMSSVAGGIAAVRLSGDGLMSGMLSGLMTVVLVILFSLLPFPSFCTDMMTSAGYLSMIRPASVIGAILGHKRKEKPKTKHKKTMR
ncbi:MAG: TIGR04086 family membrane protein [Clostridia bacterium]|nr:TIGR04086 family membrane protein [Clostridia bacterium]